ncbi:MAG TPA: hypothetical protein VKE98_19830 [Gemmataceae bacterium]|nr:hypothetical protein [Gemmataceae bacterium]
MEFLEDRTAPATFTVNTINDTQDVTPGDGIAQDANGNTSLRAAIEEGNADAANGDHNITINFNLPQNSVINLGIALPALNNNFTINGPGTNSLTVQRLTTAGNFRIFQINAGMNIGICNLSIANGYAQGQDGAAAAEGGGIYNAGTLALCGVDLYDNQASYSGGAVENSGGSLTMGFCQVGYNQGGEYGGGISNDHAVQALIQNTQVFQNTAGEGGGIYNGTNAPLTINSGSQIYNNTAPIITVNNAPWGGFGGGIFNGGQFTMSNSFLGSNDATKGGGGLFCYAGTSSLDTVTIEQNWAMDATLGKGGGVYVRAGTTTLTNCTISQNRCGLPGGGTGVCWAAGATLTINNPVNITDAIVQDPNPSF